MSEHVTAAHSRSWAAEDLFHRHEPAFVWLGLILYIGLVKVIFDTFLPNAFADPDQAALFVWPAIGIYTLAGLVGAWLADRGAFPRPWTGWIVSRKAVLLPVLGGLALGVLLVALDLGTGFTKILLAHQGLEQQFTGYLPMFLFSTAGSTIVELLYRLLPLTLLQWLIAERIRKGRGREQVFWALAVLTALVEPLGLIDSILLYPVPVAAAYFSHMFGLNLFQAVMFRRSGFLAAIVVRVAFYMIWHVLYIH